MFDVGLMVGFAAVFVATLAGILGVWMERDRTRPPWFALFFSVLIVFASFIECGRTVVSAWNDNVAKDAMASVLEQLTALAENSDNPELASFVGAELARSNPKVLKRVQKKVSARGGDPDAVKRTAAAGRGAGDPERVRKTAPTGSGVETRSKAGKAGEAGAGGGPNAEGRDGKAPDGEGKAGKAGEGAIEGKTGKAVEGAMEGKAGKAVEGAVEGKTGKAIEGAVEGKAGKAIEGATEGKVGKTVDGLLDPKSGKIKIP